MPKHCATYEELLNIAMCVNGSSAPPRAKLLGYAITDLRG